MSAAESLGSHQLNSFVAFLEEKLHTSSENSIVQNPQLKKMAELKKPQKGGKKHEVNTAFEIPMTSMQGTAHPLRKQRMSTKCAFRRLRGGGPGNGGITAM